MLCTHMWSCGSLARPHFETNLICNFFGTSHRDFMVVIYIKHLNPGLVHAYKGLKVVLISRRNIESPTCMFSSVTENMQMLNAIDE